jgi:hypothetical protein
MCFGNRQGLNATWSILTWCVPGKVTSMSGSGLLSHELQQDREHLANDTVMFHRNRNQYLHAAAKLTQVGGLNRSLCQRPVLLLCWLFLLEVVCPRYRIFVQ